MIALWCMRYIILYHAYALILTIGTQTRTFWWAIGLSLAFFTVALICLIEGARYFNDYGAGCEGALLFRGMLMMFFVKVCIFGCIVLLVIKEGKY